MDTLVRADRLAFDHSAVIDRMGGTVAVARLCEVSPQAVTQWRRYGIPKPRLMYLQVMRPEAFAPAPRQSEAA